MTYQVFARKYRPQTFDEILGQDHVVRTLKNAIERNRIAQAYLFVGPRGTGKTTTARILAKALNCSGGPKVNFDPDEDICREIAEGRSIDVLEIDGASNNGVEDVRTLRENVSYAPARGRFRIYYIDEVHMLSPAAFNALLKTLEEPPAHVKFIFATTEPTKILPTILSRCQRFDLRRIPESIIADHLLAIAAQEGLSLHPDAALAVARGADGGMRDAESMLDQLVSYCGDHIDEEHVTTIFGLPGRQTVAGLTHAVLERETAAALQIVHDQSEAGRDLSRLLTEIVSYLRTLLVYRLDPTHGDSLPQADRESLAAQPADVDTERLLELIDLLADAEGRMRGAANKRLQLEVTLIKAIQNLGSSNLSDVLAALGRAASGEEIPGDRGDQEGRPASSQSAPSQVASRRQPAGKSTSASARPPQQASGLTTGSLEAQATPRRQSDAMERPPQAGFDPQLWNRLLQHPDLSTTTALALKNVEPKQRGDSVLTLGLAEHASGFERKLVQDALPRVAALLRSLSGVPWALEIGDTAARKSDAETATPASESDPDRDDDPLIEAAIRKFAATIESRPVRPPIS